MSSLAMNLWLLGCQPADGAPSGPRPACRGPAGTPSAPGTGPAAQAPGPAPAPLAPTPTPKPARTQPGIVRQHYLVLLGWAFTLFNSVRVFSYLPTLWAIHASGDSSQHSLVTWLTWLGANITMAAWLFEHNGQRCNRAVMVNIGNATMCLITCLVIGWHRF